MLNLKSLYLVIVCGFAMFSMFFGSGNLVFPISVGQVVQGNFVSAIFGVILSGVVLPFLGVLTLMHWRGDYGRVFGMLGQPLAFIVPLLMLLLMGPFGVIPRCINVAHGSFILLLPDFPLWLFSLIFCGVILLLLMDRHSIVDWLGLVLTPFLLFSLGIIAYFGVLEGRLSQMSASPEGHGFVYGLVRGYQMMDLLAAFFFSTVIYDYIKTRTSGGHPRARLIFSTCLVAGGLLGGIYAVFVYLGAVFSPALAPYGIQQYLGQVAFLSLDRWAAGIVCVAVILACLTTGVVLTTVFSSYFNEKVTGRRVTYQQSMGVTLVVSYFVSTLEFSGIAAFLGPIITVMYPGLVMLAIVGLLPAPRETYTMIYRWLVLVTFALSAAHRIWF